MAYFEPLNAVLNKNSSHKWILHPLKHTSIYLNFFVSSTIWRGESVSHRHQQRKKLTIYCNTPFETFKEFTMNSSNSDGDRNLTSQDNKVYIPVVADVIGASETG